MIGIVKSIITCLCLLLYAINNPVVRNGKCSARGVRRSSEACADWGVSDLDCGLLLLPLILLLIPSPSPSPSPPRPTLGAGWLAGWLADWLVPPPAPSGPQNPDHPIGAFIGKKINKKYIYIAPCSAHYLIRRRAAPGCPWVTCLLQLVPVVSPGWSACLRSCARDKDNIYIYTYIHIYIYIQIYVFQARNFQNWNVGED